VSTVNEHIETISNTLISPSLSLFLNEFEHDANASDDATNAATLDDEQKRFDY
jgi:hypothetical protein